MPKRDRATLPSQGGKGVGGREYTEMLEVGKNSRTVFHYIGRAVLNDEQLRAIWFICTPNDRIFDDELGTIESYYGGKEITIYPDRPGRPYGPQKLVVNNPMLDPHYRLRLLRRAPVLLKQTISKMGEFSRIGGMQVLKTMKRRPFFSYSPKLFLWKALQREEVQFIVVTGRHGSGKTDIMFLLGEMADAEGFHEFGNVGVLDSPKKSWLLFDEGKINWDKVKSIMPENYALELLATIFRKLNINLVYVAQRAETVPSSICEFCNIEIQKTAKKSLNLFIDELGITDEVKDVDRTRVPFLTKHISPFDATDVNLDLLLRKIGKLPKEANQYEYIIKFLDRDKSGLVMTKEVRDTVIAIMSGYLLDGDTRKKQQVPIRRIAALTGVSLPTIIKIRKRYGLSVAKDISEVDKSELEGEDEED
jgi:hypothetical protein